MLLAWVHWRNKKQPKQSALYKQALFCFFFPFCYITAVLYLLMFDFSIFIVNCVKELGPFCLLWLPSNQMLGGGDLSTMLMVLVVIGVHAASQSTLLLSLAPHPIQCYAHIFKNMRSLIFVICWICTLWWYRTFFYNGSVCSTLFSSLLVELFLM